MSNKLRGDRLKKLRKELKLTQGELAQLVDSDIRQIVRWEKEAADPSSEVVAALATIFRVSADYLLGLTNEPNPHLIEADLTNEERDLILALRKREGNRAIQAFAVLSKNTE